MQLKQQTEQHLKDAFAGESQANRRYLYFAAKAELKATMMWPPCSAPLPRRDCHAHGHWSIWSSAVIRPPLAIRPHG